MKEKIQFFMLKKLNEFIDAMLLDNQDINKKDKDKIKYQLSKLFDNKTKSLIEALFSCDKLKWYFYF